MIIIRAVTPESKRRVATKPQRFGHAVASRALFADFCDKVKANPTSAGIL